MDWSSIKEGQGHLNLPLSLESKNFFILKTRVSKITGHPRFLCQPAAFGFG